MNIIVNCVGWAKELRGVDRYYVELLKELVQLNKDDRYYIFKGIWQKYFDGFGNFRNVKIINIHWSPLRVFRNIWHGFVFPIRAMLLKPDIVHLPNTMPLFFKVCPTICTIHDLLEYTCPDTFGFIQVRMRKFLVRMETKNANHIIAVSDLTHDSLVDILGIKESKIVTIYSGVSSNSFSPFGGGSTIAKDPFRIDSKYILFVGVLEKKKNLKGLIEAYNMLPENIKNEYQLVIAGKADNAYESALMLISKLRLTDKVIFLNHVDKHLEYLYQRASLFVLPSFYEGFGLPVFEAIACGIPVVVSNRVAVAQCLQGCCEVVSPYDPQSIASGMLKILTHKRAKKFYIRSGMKKLTDYTWKNCAKRTLEAYRKCVKTARARKQ